MFFNNISAGNVESLDRSKIEQYGEQLLDWAADKVFDFIIAIVFMTVGFKLCKFIVKIIKKSFSRTGMEDSVEGFLISVIKGILYMVVVIMAASIVGIQVTSLIAILGTASLSIGLALQGSLANFAGGVLILLMKPFKVGDYIIENEKNCEGTVVSIDIFYTKLKTADNRIIVIPNGNITANSIVNVTSEPIRRLDIMVNVAYDSDIGLVKETLMEAVDESGYREKEHEVNIYVDSLLDSSIQMGVRFYVKTEDYWKAKWEVTESVKLKFDREKIEIPYNHIEVIMNK